MTENNEEIWRHDDLEINDDGKVVGSAFTWPFEGGYDVVVSVFSYEYERNGETKMNHVPNVVVSDPDGGIVSEPEAWDSSNPEKAIENARSTAEDVYNNPERYID